MDLEEFETQIHRLRSAGRISDDSQIKVRNPGVSEDAMAAGSDGWIEADAILVVEGDIYLEAME